MKISNICMRSDPCQHRVTFPDGKEECMFGHDIYKLGIHPTHPLYNHFKVYKNWDKEEKQVTIYPTEYGYSRHPEWEEQLEDLFSNNFSS